MRIKHFLFHVSLTAWYTQPGRVVPKVPRLMPLLTAALLVVTLAGCFSPWTGDGDTGSVEIRIGAAQSRAVIGWPVAEESVKRIAHTITLTKVELNAAGTAYKTAANPAFEDSREISAGEETVSFTGLASGYYAVTAIGTWNGKPFSYFTSDLKSPPALPGTGVVRVEPGQTAGASLTMKQHDEWTSSFYLIESDADLRKIGKGYPLDGNYILMNDITLSGEWLAIGNNGVAPPDDFTGVFDGNGRTITGLRIQDVSLPSLADNFGLFARIADGGTVTNLKLKGVDIYLGGGHNRVGAIAGDIDDGSVISDCEVSGRVQGDTNIGGVVGLNGGGGSIKNCVSTADVRGNTDVGGVVGSNSDISPNTGGSIINSSSSGNVTGGRFSIGGVAGYSNGTIVKCSSTGTVTGTGAGTGDGFTGGVVGTNEGGVSYSYHSTANVSGSGECTGGVAGKNSGTIEYCYSSGTVDGGKYTTGGVVGGNSGTIAYCFAEGEVTGGTYVGGVAGGSGDHPSGIFVEVIIKNSYYAGPGVIAEGISDANSSTIVGGVVGYGGATTGAKLENCYAVGTVEVVNSGPDGSIIGGVMGNSAPGGLVTNCVALNDNLIVPAGVITVGRVLGDNGNAAIENSYGKDDIAKNGVPSTLAVPHWNVPAKDGGTVGDTMHAITGGTSLTGGYLDESFWTGLGWTNTGTVRWDFSELSSGKGPKLTWL